MAGHLRSDTRPDLHHHGLDDGQRRDRGHHGHVRGRPEPGALDIDRVPVRHHRVHAAQRVVRAQPRAAQHLPVRGRSVRACQPHGAVRAHFRGSGGGKGDPGRCHRRAPAAEPERHLHRVPRPRARQGSGLFRHRGDAGTSARPHLRWPHHRSSGLAIRVRRTAALHGAWCGARRALPSAAQLRGPARTPELDEPRPRRPLHHLLPQRGHERTASGLGFRNRAPAPHRLGDRDAPLCRGRAAHRPSPPSTSGSSPTALSQ